MSKFQDALKQLEIDGAKGVEALLIAGLQDLVALVPQPYGAMVVGLEAAMEPALKAFLDAQIAKLG